ncbi:MAG: DUF4178 domain-containing protein [Deltaproteobacteria bacterium]|nr:DUF4178 domain-containing protein [Deltaproteobacteria bacterium]
MSRQLHCPNCGGEHTLVNPGVVQVVCNFCQTVLFWGADEVMQVGEKSILPESDSRLFMFANGRLQGVGFQVSGHLRYDHGRGAWDEWFLQLDDGREAWLSEDEREITLELPIEPDQALPAVQELQVGMPITIQGVQYTVREIGTATTVGGEGQMPFVMRPGETYPYADLASLDGQYFATLEYDDGGVPTVYGGYPLSHEHLQIQDEKPPSTAAPEHGANITCTNCSAPLEVPQGRPVETKVCEYCGAQLDLTSAEKTVLGQNPQGYEPEFRFTVGQAATFKGKPHEVCGRMLYEDPEGYQSREYLLFNAEEGYLWLAEENGHFVLNQPTQQAPSTDPFSLPQKAKVDIAGTTFQMFEQGYSTQIYVDGALPWQARAGDTFQYADLIAPPQVFGVETDGQEVEYFHGRYMTVEEVYTAFGITEPPHKPEGVHAGQPFIRGAVTKLVMLFGLLFAFANLGLAIWTSTSSGTEVLKEVFHPDDYLKETSSKPFALKGGGAMAVRIYAPLKNSWLAVNIAFLETKSKNVLAEVWDHGIQHYSGYDWSEGERSSTKYFRAPKAGTYKLLLKASGGSGFKGPPRRENMVIRVFEGQMLSRWFWIAFGITILFPLWGWGRKKSFEGRRWAEVIDDDDDDDDDY